MPSNDWTIGLQYNPKWNNVDWSQPTPGGLVYPQQQNDPFVNYPVPGQFFVELTGLWVAGCGHWMDLPLLQLEFDYPSGQNVMLVCCSLCSYIQYAINPWTEAYDPVQTPIVII